jgi:hypothetical protein
VTPAAVALAFDSATRQVPVTPAVDGARRPASWSDARRRAALGRGHRAESAVKRVTEVLAEPCR